MNTKYRRPLIAGNWKMNLLPSDVKPFAQALKDGGCKRGDKPLCRAALCVPAVMLPLAVRALHGTGVSVGAQDVSAEEKGAFTGEVSAAQLADAGAKYVIVGHSERRQYHGETDSLVGRKLRAALAHGLSPILCVGETLVQRDCGTAEELVRLQLKTALSGLEPADAARVTLAYEPIWAIGTGRNATPAQAQEVCGAIRALLREQYGARVARRMTILYGGSMTPENAPALLAQPDVDGGLIGGASLDPAKFMKLIEITNL